MKVLDKPVSRAVSWDRGDFIVTLYPAERPDIDLPQLGIRHKRGRKTLYFSLPYIWAQMCKKEASS